MLNEAAAGTAPIDPQYQLFSGPSPYVARTPWRPWTAVGVTAAIFISAFAVVAAITVMLKLFTSNGVNIVNVALFVTPIQQLAMVGLTLLAARAYGAKASEVLSWRSPPQGLRAYVISFVAFIAIIAAMGVLIHALAPEANKDDNAIFLQMFKSPWWPLAILLVGVGAPVSEELLFRGYLFPAIAQTRLGLWGATGISSGLWAVSHAYSGIGMVQVFVIGLILSLILVRTGSLRVTMVCHALYNTMLAGLMMAGADNWL